MGIELEISNRHISREAIYQRLQPIVEAEGHIISSQEAGNCWTVKTDGSCGFEVTTPAIRATENNFEKLYRIIKSFRRSIAGTHIINRACGLHVHFSIREFNNNQIRNLITTFRSFEDVLLSLQPASRHANYYTERIKGNNGLVQCLESRNFNVANIPITSHYCGLSFNRYSQRKTVEIRYGAGSIRERKVVNWAQTLLYLIEYAKRAENVVYIENATLDNLKSLIRETTTNSWLDRRKVGLCCWLQRRYNELNNPERSEGE
jgi:hypothetical protein